MIKTKKEIKYLRKAAKITAAIFREIHKKIKPGVREKDIAEKIENAITERELKRSFKTIVASGPNAAKPHARPTNRVFKKNDVIVVDLGVIYKGYHADMTRMVILGKMDPRLKLLFGTVKKAQGDVIKKVKAGIKISELVKSVNNFIRKKGLGKYILHTLGHGVGLKIHEAPKLSEKNNGALKEGMVITIEPGLYIENLGGIRIEDMVLVKKKGCEVLTR